MLTKREYNHARVIHSAATSMLVGWAEQTPMGCAASAQPVGWAAQGQAQAQPAALEAVGTSALPRLLSALQSQEVSRESLVSTTLANLPEEVARALAEPLCVKYLARQLTARRFIEGVTALIGAAVVERVASSLVFGTVNPIAIGCAQQEMADKRARSRRNSEEDYEGH